MKKYKILSEHPFLRPGLFLNEHGNEEFYSIENFNHSYSSSAVYSWLKNGWLKIIDPISKESILDRNLGRNSLEIKEHVCYQKILNAMCAYSSYKLRLVLKFSDSGGVKKTDINKFIDELIGE